MRKDDDQLFPTAKTGKIEREPDWEFDLLPGGTHNNEILTELLARSYALKEALDRLERLEIVVVKLANKK
jgi:hypothetical protein